MKEKDEWIPYQELDFDDEKFNVFSIDTRDFHAGYTFKKEPHPSIETLIKYKKRFFNTKEDVISYLNRIYDESGGKAKWRSIITAKHSNWQLKYIRIWRTDHGFLICDDRNQALRKEDLIEPINQEFLHTH
jgi:hypothetical protein